MREIKRCPLLREEKVIYCKNFPLKKTLPFERVFERENLCLKQDHVKCPLYTKGMVILQKEIEICPFVGFENASFCIAYPLKKITTNTLISSPCNSPNYEECAIYKRMATGRETEKSIVNYYGFLIDETKEYIEGHMWIKRRDSLLRIGLDDFGQFILGEIKEIKVREKRERVREGEWLIRCKTEMAEIELFSPFEGIVEDVNEKLIEFPFLPNLDPYGNGWLIELRVEDLIQAFGVERAKEFTRRDALRLQAFLEKSPGLLMADGGEIARKEIRNLLKQRAGFLITEFLKGKEV